MSLTTNEIKILLNIFKDDSVKSIIEKTNLNPTSLSFSLASLRYKDLITNVRQAKQGAPSIINLTDLGAELKRTLAKIQYESDTNTSRKIQSNN